MAQQTLSGKVETQIQIQAPAARFYNIFRKKLNHLPNMSADVHGAKVHKGDWENVGSVKHWDITIEGKKTIVKEKIQAVDDDNKLITYSLFDGEISEGYKSFIMTLQVTDKEIGGLVKWTIEYEKLKENITASSPDTFLAFATTVTKDIDANLVEG
uniref:Bet v I/Major latex protein domain-containing protein n=2 Tax=Lotus japonicus TaxID=34305 RepID=I3SXL3_LOTJA|nr:unknown [Lotus japonicus]